MAGGKLTPRQKMVNLMYLVFIAMLALNMSKEVLSAFGLMNEKFEDVNKFSGEYNKSLFDNLAKMAGEKPGQFTVPYNKAKEIQPITDEFYKYLGELKKSIETHFEKEKGKLPYEAMDKGDMVDEAWFAGDGYSKKGKEIIATIEKYKADLKAVIGTDVKYQFIITDIDAKFNLSDIKDKEGVKKKYLDYHYKGFPAIASVTKLTAMQNDVKKTEQDIYNGLIGNTTAQAASMKNYKAMVMLDKNAYFQGEKVTGKVVLGRYDENTKPTSFQGPGKIDPATGQAIIEMTAGSVGEQNIKGKFNFLEDGENVPLDFEGTYVVVPRPNSATISADKMNSVYRGVDNPMTVSFAGVASSNVTATVSGGSWKKTGEGKYTWNVTSASGTSAKINVTATLPDGKKVTDTKDFVVRNIPTPLAEMRGVTGSRKGNKNDLLNTEIKVNFADFVFEVTPTVTQFELSVPGKSTIIVQGNRFNGQAQALINGAKKGDIITINKVKCKLRGAESYIVKDSTPFTWEVQ